MSETDEITREDEDWVQVGHYPNLEQAYDHGLVILAMGEACRVAAAETPGEFDLHAEARPAPRISEELDAYGQDEALPVEHKTAPGEWTRHSPGYPFCALWILALVVVFQWQGQDPSLVRRAASSSIGLIQNGEWWRPITALFLHADITHLVGNLVLGSMFGVLVARSVGPFRGWAAILGCGALGNAITSALTYPELFLSIGASTAVFAALGILTGLGAAESLRERARRPWLRITVPLVAGFILLGWLGGATEGNTDVMGHVFGFTSGLAAGVTAGVLESRRIRKTLAARAT
ncbi:MAG: rhomboid family intramembrane serine protease [Akkermansiaceae bacterium]